MAPDPTIRPGPPRLDQEKLIDAERLAGWLDEHIPELGSGPLEARKIHGGTSNVIVSLDRGQGPMVLRRPPAVPPPNSEKSILREARVLEALNGTSVPHPRCYGRCEDLDVIGTPFYVMELVSGWAAELIDGRIHHKPPFNQPPYENDIAYAMVDGLVALATVDHEAVGLRDFGRPERFLERQVDRWEGQLHSYEQLYGYRCRELPGFSVAADWLRSNVPSSSQAGIIHGDVGTPNALFADGPPARLSALIDWELSTIGDPLLDLAWFANGLRDERWPDHVSDKNLYAVENMPTRQELARHYAAGTGRDVGDFDFYLVLAMFKAGCILEYKVAQSAAGILSAETGQLFSRLVLSSFAEAERLIRYR